MLGFFPSILRQLTARCFSFRVSIYFLFSLLYFTVLICMCVCVCVRARTRTHTHTCGSIVSETLCDPHGPPGSSIHRIFQATILKWVTISFPRGIFWTQGLNPHLLRLLLWQAGSVTVPPGKPLLY